MSINMKRVLSFITAAIMSAVSIINSFTVSAEEYNYNQANPSMQNDIYMEGTNSFGNMLASEISAKQAEQDENNGYNVFSIEMSGKLADIEFQTLSAATLVVGIYSEDGRQLIATGSKDVAADETEALLEIETDTMPQYYYIKAYLVNFHTMRPLCTVYECTTYTQEMQEFLAKTVNDFESDRILNLDNDPTNNFAVYNDNVIIIPQTGANNVVSADDERGIYVIENADENITSLQVGDTFSYEYGDNQILIVNIKDIIVNGTTVTITSNENAVEEVFDYVKIDTSESTLKMSVDTSSMDEGVLFNGTVDEIDNILNSPAQTIDESVSPMMSRAVDITAEGEVKPISFTVEKEFDSGVKIEGLIAVSINTKLKIYISRELKSVEFSIDYGLAVKGEISGKIEAVDIPLAELNVSNIPGVFIGLKLKLIVEASAEVTITYKIEGTIGIKHDNKYGRQLIYKAPVTSSELKIDGTVFLGLDFGPAFEILNEKVAGASLSSRVGIEIEGVVLDTSEMTEVELHDCKLCYDGEIKVKYSLSYEFTLLDIDSLKFSGDFLEVEAKLTDWYYSDTFHEFAFTECPHRKFKYLISVRENDTPTEATITIDGTDHNTDTNGQLKIFLNTGTHEIMAYKGTYSSKKLYIPVSDSAGSVNLHLIPAVCSTPNTPSEPNPTGEIKFKQVSLGINHSAAITTTGDLYMWGDNSYGQLGNGTTVNSSVPIKIMSDVAYVSLGCCNSAAIKTNGDLYTWGDNGGSKLGIGDRIKNFSYVLYKSTPTKIMSNVSYVSLGYYHSAAIKSNGDLYTWGSNLCGELGNGTETNSSIPIKIIGNVSSVELGVRFSAAVTNDGNLYTWGANPDDKGILLSTYSTPQKIMNNVIYVNLGGDFQCAVITADNELYTWNNINDSFELIKKMDNVISVSLGKDHGAAITTTGVLYAWGENYFGQIGNGLNIPTLGIGGYVPIKIMENVSWVDFGNRFSAVITTSGDLYTWGNNSSGQLGNGTTTNRSIPTKITIPQTSAQSIEYPAALSAYSLESPNRTVTGLIPNEIYNIYGMKSRTAEKPFGAENLLYISQAVTDNSGTLTFEYLPDEECVNPEIFVKAMREFDVPNAQINYAEEKNGTVSLKWDSIADASQYTVYSVRNGVYIKEADISGTEYSVSGLVAGTQYGFIVQSCVNGEYSLLDKNDVIYITPEQPVIAGDVNGDGKITAVDLILVRRYIVHVDDEISSAADMNNDGKITAADFIILRRLYMSMQT